MGHLTWRAPARADAAAWLDVLRRGAGPFAAAWLGARRRAACRRAGRQQHAGPAFGALIVLAGGLAAPVHVIVPGTASASAATGRQAGLASEEAAFARIILPDLLIVAPRGLTSAQITALGRISHVRNTIAVDGAEITAAGRRASVIGVDPAKFRSWVPLHTASDQAFWTALQDGDFVAAGAARARLGLRRGVTYQLSAATSAPVTFGAAAQLGIAGVDLLVNGATSARLGLVHRVAAMISAPGASLAALASEVRAILGPAARIVSLRQQQLPVTAVSGSQLPGSYLDLFKASAARYCPGLSWTVLAAIGQIESADGTNVGPSTAGALGPMQFLPSTWTVWGIDGFGQAGPPDIMNPYDAVPAAARLLCADGAAAGGRSLAGAIFDYNHAEWYVNEVLALAGEYAADYR